MRADSGSSGWMRRVSAVKILAPVGGGCPLPYYFAQSLRTKRVSFVLRIDSKMISGQSPQSKAVDLCSTRTFFVPEIDSNR
jgi:hypothetical protein